MTYSVAENVKQSANDFSESNTDVESYTVVNLQRISNLYILTEAIGMKEFLRTNNGWIENIFTPSIEHRIVKLVSVRNPECGESRLKYAS